MNENLLELNQVSYSYGRFRALNDLTIKLPAGRVVGLLGPNGSGKTTLLKILAGLLSNYSGTVKISGDAPGSRTKGLVSFLPDSFYLNKRLRAGDAIMLFERYYSDFNRAKADQLLSHFQLDSAERIGEMSKGMREKLQVVLNMSRDAAIYLLDEPISGVDPASRTNVIEAITASYRPGSLMVISTHLIHDIEDFLDDVIFLNQGQIHLFDQAHKLREKYQLTIDQLFREVFKWSAN